MPERELNGWKEIAAYLGKAVRTAQRWEQDLGLPVRRIPGPTGDIVFAKTSELDRWREEASRTKAGARELRDADPADNASDLAPDDRKAAPPPTEPVAASPSREAAARPRLAAGIGLAAVAVLAAVFVVGSRFGFPGGGARHAPPAAAASAVEAAVLDGGPWPMDGHDSRRSNQSTVEGPASPGSSPRLVGEAGGPGDLVVAVAVTSSGRVLFGGCGWISAVELSGRTVWRRELASEGFKMVPSGVTMTHDGLALVTVLECPDLPGGLRTHLYGLGGNGEVSLDFRQGATYAGAVIGPDRTIYTLDEIALLRAFQPWLDHKWSTVLAGFSNRGLAIDSRGNLYAGTDGGLYHQSSFWSVAPDGSIRWHALTDDLGRPAISRDDRVYVAGRTGNVWAFTPEGRVAWTTNVGPIASLGPLAVGASGTVYVKTATSLVALAEDGTVKWRYGNAPSISFFASAILDRDENVYAQFGDRVCSTDRSGRERWCVPVKQPGIMAFAGDGRLLVVSEQKRIYEIGEQKGQ